MVDLLSQSATQAHALGVTLHISLHLGDKPAEELTRLAAALEKTRLPVSAWFVIAADPKRKTFQWARQYLSGYKTDALLGVGEALSERDFVFTAIFFRTEHSVGTSPLLSITNTPPAIGPASQTPAAERCVPGDGCTGRCGWECHTAGRPESPRR